MQRLQRPDERLCVFECLEINSDIRSKTQVNQLRSTNAVLEWFNALPKKEMLPFLVFDIVDFYPSISEQLLSKSLEWGKSYTRISNTERDTILHARRPLLYDDKGAPWVKRNVSNQFDVTMGAFDGAEVCELVGLFLLSDLTKKLDLKSIGLYRDDGLAVKKSSSGSNTDSIRRRRRRKKKNLGKDFP
ncbi:hypothetical protein HOLleu_02755 [Holothuria leucospilota]|uniref:Uncharacterized protein n=1 Tax=Holothuria leucospilota TaxID=206669 RepID=A0A9Q1CS28_HOLLE|nr:hypothetical protein HOLleu_02755 [Holothuria leucospilota]